MARWATLFLVLGVTASACGGEGGASTGSDAGFDGGDSGGSDAAQGLDCSEDLAATGTHPSTWDWGPDGLGCPPEVVSLDIEGQLDAGTFWVTGTFEWHDRESDVARMDVYCFHEEDLASQDGAIASGSLPGPGEPFTPTSETGDFEVGTIEPEGAYYCDLWLIDAKGNASALARAQLLP